MWWCNKVPPVNMFKKKPNTLWHCCIRRQQEILVLLDLVSGNLLQNYVTKLCFFSKVWTPTGWTKRRLLYHHLVKSHLSLIFHWKEMSLLMMRSSWENTFCMYICIWWSFERDFYLYLNSVYLHAKKAKETQEKKLFTA